jgi:hypothetical protein
MQNNKIEYLIILRIIIILINFFVLNWLIKLDKCKCADINDGLYLKEWFVFIIILNIIKIFYIFIYGTDNNQMTIFLLFNIIIIIVNFIMIIRLLIYIYKLKQLKCDCNMSIQQNIIYYWYIILLSIILLLILLIASGYLILLIKK